MKSQKKLLVTGATGFVGQKLIDQISVTDTYELFIASRKKPSNNFPWVPVSDINGDTDWCSHLEDTDVVIHCAARAHLLNDSVKNPSEAFRSINTDGTLALAKQAAEMGVHRFIFISSIGVNGSASPRPFTPDLVPNPSELYAQSKLEAEQGLWEIQKIHGMEIVVIRPPLVYGPCAPGNFGLLTSIVRKGLPLPLAGIENQRSLVSIWNLVDLIITAIEHPDAAGQVFLVRDGQDVSTSELLLKLGEAQGRPVRLFWLPRQLLKIGAITLGKKRMYHRLFDSLQVDDTTTRQRLDWSPPLSLEDGLRRCFQEHH